MPDAAHRPTPTRLRQEKGGEIESPRCWERGALRSGKGIPRFSLVWGIVWTLYVGVAMAQQPLRLDPSDPGVPVAAIRDSSAFAGYRPFREQKPAPWKEIIDEVSVRPAGAEHAGHDAGGALSQPAIQAATQTPTPPAGAVAQAGVADSGIVAAVGVVREIDRANAKVKLAHEPIEVLGWPSMTM